MSGWPAGGDGADHTGGGSLSGDEPPNDGDADGELSEGEVEDGTRGSGVADGRFDGRPVVGSVGVVALNGGGVICDDGVPVGD